MFKEYKDYWLMILGILGLFGASLFITNYTKSNPQFVPNLFETIGTLFDGSKVSEAPKLKLDSKTVYQADINTTAGTIRVNLLTPYAVENVNNFAFIAKNGWYNNSTFANLDNNADGLVINMTITNNARVGYQIKSEINWASLNLTDSQKQQLTKDGFQSTSDKVTSPFKQYSIGLVQTDQNYSKGAFFIFTNNSNDSVLKYNGKYTKIAEVVNGQDILTKIIDSLKDPKSTPIKITGVVVYE